MGDLHPIFGAATRAALRDLPAAAAAGPLALTDGRFGDAHAAAAEAEFEALIAAGRLTPTVSKTFLTSGQAAGASAASVDVDGAIEAGAAERGDHTLHLDADAFESHPALRELPALGRVVRFMRSLRAALGGMRRTSLMLTCYPGGGARFSRHFDSYDWAPRATSRYARWTAIYYPNRNWARADGGALRLHAWPTAANATGGAGSGTDVAPLADRLVLFNASALPHEVLPARRRRFALTAWFFECDTFPSDAAAESGAPRNGSQMCVMPNGYGGADGADGARGAHGAVLEAAVDGDAFLRNQCEFLVCASSPAGAGANGAKCVDACVRAVHVLREVIASRR